MNRQIKYFLLIMTMIFAVNIIGCEGGCPLIKRERPTQPSAPAAEKFAAMSRWIPASSNAVVAADVYQLSKSRFWKRITESRPFRFFELIQKQGINLVTDIGMICLFAEVQSITSFKGPVLLLQGGFNQDLILTRIKSEALKEGLGLKEEVYKDEKIYAKQDSESDGLAQQALSAIDDGIIALGSVQNLKWMIDNKKGKEAKSHSTLAPSTWDYPVWGVIKTEGTLKSSLPAPWNAIDQIELKAKITDDLAAAFSMTLSNPASTDALVGSLEGFRALEIIEYLDEPETLHTIEQITIGQEEGSIVVRLPENLKVLHHIFEPKKDKEGEEGEKESEEVDISKPDIQPPAKKDQPKATDQPLSNQ